MAKKKQEVKLKEPVRIRFKQLAKMCIRDSGIGDISHISVKKNALELLDHELGTKRGKATIGTGSMNDPCLLYTSRCV